MMRGSAERPEITALLDDFAVRSFRDIADGDYIVARAAIRVELLPQFLWSGLQAIEKYLKAILLINRISFTKPTHSLSGLLTKVDGIKKLRFGISPATRKFIDYLDMYGRFRYLEVSYHGKARDLVALDRAVWEIRRYCAPLDYYVARGGKNISDRKSTRLNSSHL